MLTWFSFVCARLSRNLRLLNIGSGVLMFMYNVGATERPLLIGMRWGLLLAAINLLQVRSLALERREGILPPREARVYADFFSHGRLLSETSFRALAAEGEWQTLHAGARVTEQGCANEWSYLLLDGSFRVTRRGHGPTGAAVDREVARLAPGSWVGERGFLRQFVLPAFVDRDNGTAPSVATVTVQSETARVLRWRRAELNYMMEQSPALNVGVLLSMLRDVVRKLRVQSELNSDMHAYAVTWPHPVAGFDDKGLSPVSPSQVPDGAIGRGGLASVTRVASSIWRRPQALHPAGLELERLRRLGKN